VKTILAILLTVATLRADYTYQSTTRLTGARDSSATTNFIKGNRMAIVAKNHTTVIDLDKETIVEIDVTKKQYSVITFAQMKQAMQDAVAKSNTEASFKVSAKATGQTKAVGVLKAKELVLTITGSMDITVDSWLASIPGYEEVKEFHRKMGEKLGYAFASGMPQIAMAQPQSLQGFAEVAKEMNKVEGVPVQSTTKMGSAGETTTELGSFSSGPVDAAKFEVPAGFKKVDAKR
jgi:hypothetical protein